MPTLTVTQATPTITWNDPDLIVYGTALGATQLDATASVPGTFTYTPGAGTVWPAGSGQTLSVSFKPTDNTDYNSRPQPRRRSTSRKQRPSITWDNLAPITYGAALSSAQLDATASVTCTFTNTPAPGMVLHPGNGQTLSVSFAPTDSTDFNTASATATLNVEKATPSITWANLGNITYGTQRCHPPQLDATASVPGTFSYTPARGMVPHAGNGETLSVSFTPSNTTDYSATSAIATLNVEKATPSITWANLADITYGTALSSAQLEAIASGEMPARSPYTPGRAGRCP